MKYNNVNLLRIRVLLFTRGADMGEQSVEILRFLHHGGVEDEHVHVGRVAVSECGIYPAERRVM